MRGGSVMKAKICVMIRGEARKIRDNRYFRETAEITKFIRTFKNKNEL